MHLASIDGLDLPKAWARARTSASTSGIPDRLPFEVLVRLNNSGYQASVGRFATPYAPGTPVVVFAPKESRTLRPFVALPPLDHVLYQGLVDKCIPHLLRELPEEHVVFQYRPMVEGKATFGDRPTWRDFVDRTRSLLTNDFAYVLETDIAGFFLHIRPERIFPPLLASGVPLEVISDLRVLLAHFELHGVQGLPQGQAASSALSNVALRPLDRMLAGVGITYARWSDDLRVFAHTYSEARRSQELIERRLFEDGFTLAAGKTFVRKAATALQRMEDLDASLARIRDDRIRQALSFVGPYDAEEEAIEEALEQAEQDAIEAFYADLVTPIKAAQWSRDPLFRTKLSYALRALAGIHSASAIDDAPALAWRYPDELEAIANYLRRVARDHRNDVARSLMTLHRRASYAADYQRLSVASAAVALAPTGPDIALATRLAKDAADASLNPILRRRAGLAATALGERSDVTTASTLWDAFDRLPDPTLSKLYLVVGAQPLHPTARDTLYRRWKGESRMLTAVIDVIEGGSPFDLSRV